MKCKFYREKGQCLKDNDPTDMGECIYKNGKIMGKAAIHCSEGKNYMASLLKNIAKASTQTEY